MLKLVASFVLFLLCIIHFYYRIQKSRRGDERDIGLFHPYCNNGGGGERVLWLLIAALLHHGKIGKNINITIYTGDHGVDKATLIRNAEVYTLLTNIVLIVNIYSNLPCQNHFGIKIEPALWCRLKFSYIWTRKLLEPKYYPFMTMFFQSLGTLFVTIECMLHHVPDIYCDTTGASFGYPFAAWIGCRVVAYVHYPIISADMLQLVRDRRPTYNNDASIATSTSISKLKLVYYQWFASIYGFVGSFASLVLANSSWTCGHISNLWGMVENNHKTEQNESARLYEHRTGRRLVKVYPPCNTEKWKTVPLSITSGAGSTGIRRRKVVLSVGQFRPEKDHALQIRAFSKFLMSPQGSR